MNDDFDRPPGPGGGTGRVQERDDLLYDQDDDAFDDTDAAPVGDTWVASAEPSFTRAQRQRANSERVRRRRRNLRVLAVLAIILLPFVIGGVWFYFQLNPSGDPGAPVAVQIKDGWGTSEVADALSAKGVVGSSLAFKVWAAVTRAGPFDPGLYEIPKDVGVRGAMGYLEKGPIPEPNLTLLLPPGLTISEIADRVAQLPGHSREGFLKVVNSGEIRSAYEPVGVNSLEGLLFPDTYFIGAHESDDSIVHKLVARFDEIATKIGLANAPGDERADRVPDGRQRFAHPDRDQAPRGRAAHLRGRREPSAQGHAAPDRLDAVLREGRLPATPDQRGQEDRVALQHVPEPGAATDPDRERHAGEPRGGAAPGGRAVPLLRDRGQEREARVRDHSRGAQPQRRRGEGQGLVVSRAVRGSTRVVGIIGDPVAHSRSPAIHNAAFAALGLDWVFVAFPVRAGDGERAIRAMPALHIAGLNVTMPHKTDAVRACDALSARAAALQSVNTVVLRDVGLFGDSTDGEGFVRALRAEGREPAGRSCAVLGAGARPGRSSRPSARRAARSAWWPAGSTRRGRRPCWRPAASATTFDDVDEVVGTADIVVNATPVGMRGEEVPFHADVLSAGQFVLDTVYHPAETPLLAAARARGVPCANGLGMLVHQAALAFELWTGETAPLAVMLDAARADDS